MKRSRPRGEIVSEKPSTELPQPEASPGPLHSFLAIQTCTIKATAEMGICGNSQNKLVPESKGQNNTESSTHLLLIKPQCHLQ